MKKYKAYAKVNIFLKVTGLRGDYHEILSRFVRINNLYDSLYFIDNPTQTFLIEGDFSCNVQQNTIYKTYVALLEHTQSEILKTYMQDYGVKVEKSIPAFAGLGGGSSDAATYLHMCNETLNLNLSIDTLSQIGAQVGADVPFFVYGFQSANVSGVGEVVEAFEEEALDIETYTPDIEISTPKVYQKFRSDFYKTLTKQEYKELSKQTSRHILETLTPEEANDLFEPAKALYGALESAQKEGYFFSGSGSSYFRLRPAT